MPAAHHARSAVSALRRKVARDSRTIANLGRERGLSRHIPPRGTVAFRSAHRRCSAASWQSCCVTATQQAPELIADCWLWVPGRGSPSPVDPFASRCATLRLIRSTDGLVSSGSVEAVSHRKLQFILSFASPNVARSLLGHAYWGVWQFLLSDGFGERTGRCTGLPRARRAVLRTIREIVQEMFRHEQWNSGLIDAPISSSLEPPHSVKPRWIQRPRKWASFADPFGIVHESRLFVFCEYTDYRAARGRIVAFDATASQHVGSRTYWHECRALSCGARRGSSSFLPKSQACWPVIR